MVEQIMQHRLAIDLPLGAQDGEGIDARQHVHMAEHAMIMRPIAKVVEQEHAVGFAMDDRLQQARDAKAPVDQHCIGAAAHAAPYLAVIARPVAQPAFVGRIAPFAHRTDIGVIGGEFDRFARDVGLHFAQPDGIAVDADDAANLARRDQRAAAAAEFQQRVEPRQLQFELRDFRRRHMWLHGPLHHQGDMGRDAPRLGRTHLRDLRRQPVPHAAPTHAPA